MESLYKPFTISLPPRLQTCRIGWWPTRRPMERPITPSTTVQLATRHRLLIWDFFCNMPPFQRLSPPTSSLAIEINQSQGDEDQNQETSHSEEVTRLPNKDRLKSENLTKTQRLLILETLKREKGICAGAHCGLTFPGTKSICGTNLEAWIELAWITNINLLPCLHADWTGLKKTEKKTEMRTIHIVWNICVIYTLFCNIWMNKVIRMKSY